MQALGDKKGIRRFGEAQSPLDEALCECVIDVSGRPGFYSNLNGFSGQVGEFDFELGEVFFSGFAAQGFTVHLTVKTGANLHHVLEASFKAFARAMRQAIETDNRASDKVPSTKDLIDG
jgi:imidazoleglycerol-phosphate dehydratase